MKKWFWGCLITLSVLLIAGGTLPASLAWHWLAPVESKLELKHISGLWWQGQAGTAQISGQDLGQVDWRLSPASVLQGNPSLDLKIVGERVQANAQLTRLASGGARIPDLRASLDASWLAPLLKLPLLTPVGQIELRIKQLEVSPAQLPESGEITLTWQGAAFKGWLPAEVGNVHFRAKGNAGQWLGEISSDPGSALGIQGGWSLNGDQFQMELRLSAREPELPIAKILPMVGVALPDGARLLKVEGRIEPRKSAS